MIFKNLGFWVKTASLFLFRSKRSTLALSLMIFTAVSILIFLSSLAVGINDAMIRNSVSLFSGHISGFALPHSLKRESMFTEGVANVLKRVSVPGTLSRGDRVEVVNILGVDPFQEWKSTALWAKTIQGRYLQKGEQGIFLSQQLAESLKVEPGDDLLFSPTSRAEHVRLKVSGVYKTGIDQLDRGIAFSPMEAIQVKTETWSAAVFLEDGVKPMEVISGYSRRLSGSHQFKSWGELMPDLRQLIDLEYFSMGIVTALVFGVVSVGIACAFVIFVMKNLREYGIMKAMGVTSREMTLLIFSKVILMNLAASCLGILAGVLVVLIVSRIGGIDLSAFTSHNRYFAVSGVISPRLTLYSLCLPPALSFLFSLTSAVWPAVLVARKRAAEILRII